MRKTMFIIATMYAVAIGFTACSSSKAVSETIDASKKKVVEITKSEELALDLEKNGYRALGIGRAPRVQNAMTAAVTQARNEFRLMTEAWVKSAAKEAFKSVEKGASNGSEYLSVADDVNTSDQLAEMLSEGLVKNTSVINSDKILLPDGRYEVYVCIEYRGEISNMMNEMLSATKNRIPQQISDEDKLKIQFELERFKESMEEEFERYRKEKNE